MISKAPIIIEVTDATFQTEVIEHSTQRPVFVDFWAQWCGPCKTLGPALERLANDYRGAFRLAKVDVDRNPQLVMAAQVQSIPMVLAVWNNAILDRFVGALPPPELKKWVESVLQAAGVTVPSSLEENAPDDPVKAEQFWRKQLDKEANDGKALLGLGQTLIQLGRPDEARTVLERITTSQEEYNAAHAALNLLDLLAEVADAGGEAALRHQLAANPSDPRTRYLVACADAGQGRFVKALQVLVDLVSNHSGEVRENARKAASRVLSVAGRENEQIEDLRRHLALALY
ncbi:MAG: tetratricopeptide repeat protein [Bradymonadales bacterium]|nr:tetratricopeptide repeat protein [Bradymonadales bacterium]